MSNPLSTPTVQDPRVQQVCRLLDAPGDPPALAVLATKVGLSPSRLHHVFRDATGLTPKQYADARRAERAPLVLAAHRGRVLDAGLDAGFGSASRLYAHSARMLGMAPAAFRCGGDQRTLRFAMGP